MSSPNASGGINMDFLRELINSRTDKVKEAMENLKAKGESEISIGAMFELQMLMNQLSQISEASNSVVNASNQTLNSMARNTKG